MSEIAERYRRRADAFEALIAATPAGQWSSPSPCAGWSASDVVAHVIDYAADVLRERCGVADPPVLGDYDGPLAAYRASRAVLQRVFDDPATPPKLAQYLDAALSFDVPQHGWDLAIATGQDPTMDPWEVDYLWTLSEQPRGWWEWQRANGHYGPPVTVPESAPLQDRALGLIGRDPNWTPGQATLSR